MNNYGNERIPNIPAHPMNHNDRFRYEVARTESLENDFMAPLGISVKNGPISAATFKALLRQCRRPAAQMLIDYEEGIVSLISFNPDTADGIVSLNNECEQQYDRWRKRCKSGIKYLSLDYEINEDGDTMADCIPSSVSVEDEAFDVGDEDDLYLQAVSYLTESDRALMKAYREAGSNSAELARRTGADKSAIARKIKGLKERFYAALDEVKNSF